MGVSYNFDELVPRRGTYSYKWDSPDSGHPDYPLWVADMDFKTAPCVISALHQRVEHGIFGYVTTPDDYRHAVINWFAKRHDWSIRPEQIVPASAIVPALTAILRHLSEQGKNRVLLQSPAYNAFYYAIHRAGCELTETPLLEQQHHFEIDWEDLDRKLAQTDIFILCNPHNPTGRVWTVEELGRMAALCQKHQVLVLADEIHAEFVFSGYHYIPYATLATDNNYIVLTSAGKAFNIAGLQLATLIAGNDTTLALLNDALEESSMEDINCMGLCATIAAYEQGADWLDQLNHYIEGNYHALCDFFREHGSQLGVTRMEGTYLAWVDIRSLCGTDSQTWCQHLQQKTGVKLNPGEMYGAAGYIRINLACPRSFLIDALRHCEWS